MEGVTRSIAVQIFLSRRQEEDGDQIVKIFSVKVSPGQRGVPFTRFGHHDVRVEEESNGRVEILWSFAVEKMLEHHVAAGGEGNVGTSLSYFVNNVSWGQVDGGDQHCWDQIVGEELIRHGNTE